MYYSKNEQGIVEKFYKNLANIKDEDTLLLVWENSEVYALFDTCFDDYDENNEADEYNSFVFKAEKIIGNPPINITDNRYFIINYHNFPNKILLNENQIN